MDCTRCSTANDDIRKYCRSCGSPLGRICDRCGTVNKYDDKFCGVCAFALVPSLKQQANPSPSLSRQAAPGTPRQYTPEEIEEMLTLRNIVKPGEQTSATMSQDDIDKLFG